MSGCERCGQSVDREGLCRLCARFAEDFVLVVDADERDGEYRRVVRPRTEFRCGKCGAPVEPLGVLCPACIEMLTSNATTGETV